MKDREVLQHLLLPHNKDWDVVDIEFREEQSEIIVDINYNKTTVSQFGVSYPIYDYRPIRIWRHLDLWQYSTYLRARIPRYESFGKVVSAPVPWAQEHERITNLLEKKR